MDKVKGSTTKIPHTFAHSCITQTSNISEETNVTFDIKIQNIYMATYMFTEKQMVLELKLTSKQIKTFSLPANQNTLNW